MRFLIHPAARLRDWPEVHRAYVCGTDQTVFPTRVELHGNVMACRRPNSESGKLHVAWDVPGFGRPVLSTASLPERDEPYLLPVELARGKLVQLRNQAATWQGAGMQMPQGFADLNSEAHRLFARCAAVQEHPDQACALAEDVIRRACEAAEMLTRAYARQSLANRQRRYQQIPTLLGCNLSQEPLAPAAQQSFIDTFNAAGVPIEWRLIEPVEGEYHWEASDALVDWCTEHRLVARGGPLLDFSPDGLPPWLWKWEHDVSNLQSFVCDFVETAMRRYLGKIRLWEVSARVNSGGALTLSEEARLSLVAKTLEVARHVDEESQLFIRVDQPWAEYQARGQHRLSPLHFADALLRAGLGLSGVNLEIAVGYRPRGSSSRDLLDYSRLIDVWSVLGLPLHVSLAFPSGKGPDPHCTSELEVDAQSWKEGWSAAAQRDWIELHLPLFLAKPAVVGVFWTHFSDAQPHTFPHAGLLDGAGQSKPALDRIAHQRKAWLK